MRDRRAACLRNWPPKDDSWFRRSRKCRADRRNGHLVEDHHFGEGSDENELASESQRDIPVRTDCVETERLEVIQFRNDEKEGNNANRKDAPVSGKVHASQGHAALEGRIPQKASMSRHKLSSVNEMF